MTSIAQISQTMQTLLTTTTETVAATLHYAKRPDRAKFTPSTLVQTLVFGLDLVTWQGLIVTLDDGHGQAGCGTIASSFYLMFTSEVVC